MIKLFNFKDRYYTTSGISVIHPLSLMEYKETSLNGWRIEVELPIKYQDLIKEGMVALVDTKSKGPQPFIISNPTTTHVGMHFIANHYVFDAVNYVLEDVRLVNMGAWAQLVH